MDIHVVDDFIPEHKFKDLEFMMMSHAFEWYWSDGQAEIPQTDRFMFNHLFYKCGTKFGDDYIGSGPNSNHYDLIKPCIRQLRSKTIRRIKANLTTKTTSHEEGGYHTDYSDITTAVYYINTNNGYTQFKDGTKVESVANRAVIFDSNLEHQGVSCTDEKRRVVINFNFNGH